MPVTVRWFSWHKALRNAKSLSPPHVANTHTYTAAVLPLVHLAPCNINTLHFSEGARCEAALIRVSINSLTPAPTHHHKSTAQNFRVFVHTFVVALLHIPPLASHVPAAHCFPGCLNNLAVSSSSPSSLSPLCLPYPVLPRFSRLGFTLFTNPLSPCVRACLSVCSCLLQLTDAPTGALK